LQVLAFVHQQNVIHRDIKPSNLIRRSRDSKIVLIDFGAVKEVREVMNQVANIQGHSNLTVAIGSPGYMPSEQQSFHPHFSSDIYAVGIVCIQALTGLNPKELPKDSRSKEVCCSLLTDRAPVSPGLAEILDRMVRYDYRQRYENAIEALQALQQLIARSDHQIGRNASETVKLLSLPNQGTELTQAINPVNDLLNQETEPSQLPTTLQDIPNELKKQLERLLAGVIGPVASLILKQALDGVQTYEDLVDRLVVRLSEKERAKFREQASRLFKDQNLSLPVTSQNKASATTGRPTTPNTPAHAVDPSFIKCCELELAKAIGPVAPLIVQRTLSQQPNLSRIQLIETLAQHLPNSVKIEAFRQSLLIFL
jgi:serine/threonine-protein kinase